MSLGVVTFASVALSASRFVHKVGDLHADYSGISSGQRESSIVGAAGLRLVTWDFIRQHVRPTDRYVIRTPARLGTGFHRYMETFAGYWLLPAIAVTSRRRADAVVYLRMRSSGGFCREAPELVCVHRRGP